MNTPLTYDADLDAIISLADQDIKGARKALRKLVPLLPDTAPTQTALGLTYISLDQPRDAVRAFKRATELDPDDPTPRFYLGNLQSDMGLLPHAEENLRVAAVAEPENAEYQAALGFVYYRAEKTEKAIAALEAAQEQGSENAEVFASLGYLYYFDGRYEDARTTFGQAITFDADRAEYYNNRGYLEILINDLDAAQDDFGACIELDASYLRASYNRALTTWLQGDTDTAMDQYQAARRSDSGDAELKQHLDDMEEVASRYSDNESLSELRVKLAVAQKASRS